jgi:hypothetical protein
METLQSLFWFTCLAVMAGIFLVNVELYARHHPRPGGTTACPTHNSPYTDSGCVYEEPGPQLGWWMPWHGWPTLKDIENPRWDGTRK